MSYFRLPLALVFILLVKDNRCHCKSVLQLAKAPGDLEALQPELKSRGYSLLPGTSEYVGNDEWQLKQNTNSTFESIPRIDHETRRLSLGLGSSVPKLLRTRKSLAEERFAYFGLTGAKFEDGLMLYNQFIAAKAIDERVKNGHEYLQQDLNPWPPMGDKVSVPYFFDEKDNKVGQHHTGFLMQAMEDVTKNTCLSFDKAEAPAGATCKTRIDSVKRSLCVQAGDGCYSMLGSSGNPQVMTVNETCMNPAMALRLVTLVAGLGYPQTSSNYMLADEGNRGGHGYCHTNRANVSETFDIRSAGTVGFTIDFGSSTYEAVHVTPNSEDQSILHRRGDSYFGLRNVDIGQINAFNRCDRFNRCGEQQRTKCRKRIRSARYPNIVGINKNSCECLCADGWHGKDCNKHAKDPIPEKYYGCHKHVSLGSDDRDGTGGIFRLRDIHMDTTEKRPLLCTVSIRSKFRDMGYYCRGFAPIIKVDARALYKASLSLVPFSMDEACGRFRVYYQSGRHAYRRRLICLDEVLATGGKFELRPTGPNTTLFFVMDPENDAETAALGQLQIVIHNRVDVLCETILYYRNPISFKVHTGEFIFRTRYLIQALIGLVVFLICSYILYDYWSTRRRLKALKRRREAKAAKESGESSAESSSSKSSSKKSNKSSKSSLSTKSLKLVLSVLKGKEKKKKKPKPKPTHKEDSSSSDSLEIVNPFSASKETASVISVVAEEDDSKSKPEKPKEKAKKDKKAKKEGGGLPPIGGGGGKMDKSDLEDITSVTATIEEPIPSKQNHSTTDSGAASSHPRPKPARKGGKARKLRKKRQAASSSSSSSDETLRQALVRYVSGMVSSTTDDSGSDSEDEESGPA